MQLASGNLMTDMSDHFANFIILHSNIKSKETDRPIVRIYSEQNKHTFQKFFGEVNWDMELRHKNTNEAMLSLNQKITAVYNKSSSLKDCLEKGQGQAMDYYWA